MKQQLELITAPTGTSAMLRRREARDLLARVEALNVIMDESFVWEAERVARRAESLGAHSVARAIRWMGDLETLSRYGPDAVEIRVERVAHKWCARVERSGL